MAVHVLNILCEALFGYAFALLNISHFKNGTKNENNAC